MVKARAIERAFHQREVDGSRLDLSEQLRGVFRLHKYLVVGAAGQVRRQDARCYVVGDRARASEAQVHCRTC